jgi:hypothetical protein
LTYNQAKTDISTTIQNDTVIGNIGCAATCLLAEEGWGVCFYECVKLIRKAIDFEKTNLELVAEINLEECRNMHNCDCGN